jgi:hypothetical protein
MQISSVALGKLRDSASNYETTVSFHISSSPLFTYHPSVLYLVRRGADKYLNYPISHTSLLITLLLHQRLLLCVCLT